MDELYAELHVEDDDKRESKEECKKQRTVRVLILDISPRQENEYQL